MLVHFSDDSCPFISVLFWFSQHLTGFFLGHWKGRRKLAFVDFFSPTANVETAGQQFVSVGDGRALKAVSKFGSCAGEGSLLQWMQMFLTDRVLPSPLITDPLPKIPLHLLCLYTFSIFWSLCCSRGGSTLLMCLGGTWLLFLWISCQGAAQGGRALESATPWYIVPLKAWHSSWITFRLHQYWIWLENTSINYTSSGTVRKDAISYLSFIKFYRNCP